MAETADRVIVELIAQTDGYERAVNGAASASAVGMSKIERSASQAEAQVQRSSAVMGASVRQAANDIGEGSARAANATRNLGRQVADIGVGLSTGQNPFFVLAQQAPQVADALADTQGRAAQVAAFFAGPWGAALLAAGSALGILVSKSLEAGESVDDLVKKLQANAARTEVADRAARIFANTQAGVAEKVRELTKALDQQNATLRTNAELRNVQARTAFAAAEKSAADAADRLAAARRRVADAQAFAGSDESGVAAALARRERTAAERDVRAAQATAREASVALNRSRVFLAAEQAATNATQSGRVASQYDNQIRALQRYAVAQANAGKTVGKATYDRIAALEKEKAAALDAASAGSRATPLAGRSRGGSGRSAISAATDDAATAAEIVKGIAESLDDAVKSAGGAMAREADRLERSARIFKANFGEQGKDYADPFAGVAEYDRQRRIDGDIAADVERDLQDQRVANIRSLSDLYTDLFIGGTDDVWRNFKMQGLRTLALILAQATATSFGAGGGGIKSLLGNLGKAAGSVFGGGGIFGRASGGYLGPGQIARVNEGRGGVELLRMGAQGGTVIPLGRADAVARPAGPAVIHQHFTLDARYGITTPELLRRVDSVMTSRGQQARDEAVSIARREAPGAVAKAQRFGAG